jgi:hypothetical protein
MLGWPRPPSILSAQRLAALDSRSGSLTWPSPAGFCANAFAPACFAMRRRAGSPTSGVLGWPCPSPAWSCRLPFCPSIRPGISFSVFSALFSACRCRWAFWSPACAGTGANGFCGRAAAVGPSAASRCSPSWRGSARDWPWTGPQSSLAPPRLADRTEKGPRAVSEEPGRRPASRRPSRLFSSRPRSPLARKLAKNTLDSPLAGL